MNLDDVPNDKGKSRSIANITLDKEDEKYQTTLNGDSDALVKEDETYQNNSLKKIIKNTSKSPNKTK